MSITSRQKLRAITPRYAALPLISLLMKLVGYLMIGFGLAVLVVGIISAVRHSIVIGDSSGFTYIVPLIFQMFRHFIYALMLIGLAELIYVLLDIEDNTRRTADYVTGRVSGTTPRQTSASERDQY